MDLDEHNARVRALASRMPTPMLHNAVLALGYCANAQTGILQNFRQDTIVSESRKRFGGANAIGQTDLKLAIAVLKDAGIIKVMSAKVRDQATGKIQSARNSYTIDFEWQGDFRKLGDEVSHRRNEWRKGRTRQATQPRRDDGPRVLRDPWLQSPATSEAPPHDDEKAQVTANLSNTEDGPPHDDEAARAAALADDYGEPPDDYVTRYIPLGCPVCVGAHDPAMHETEELRRRCAHCGIHGAHSVQ